jgi:hypothetical protein
MKATILMITSIIAICYNCASQTTFYPTVKLTPSPTEFRHYNPSSTSTSNSSQNTAPSEPIRDWSPPVHSEPIVKPNATQTTRVTGYYEDGYGANITLKRVSLKVEITTNSMGKDEITVIEIMSESGYWTTVYSGTATKTYGNISKEFTYQVYVSSKTVYFNI